jgi:hypothetical protein
VAVEPVKEALLHPGMRRQRGPGGAAVAVDDAHHTRRDARVEREMGQTKRRERGGFRRLEHHDVPGGQRGRHLPRGDDQ